MNILELAILKKMVGGGGGSGTDNYNDLLNLPQINGETLAGNKTAENLGLQDALTFDSAPTEDSTNPVESGGVYNALAGKQDNLTFDDDPTENSTNPVKSGGVYNALAGKQDNLTFDGVYNASTNKAATESTVTNAIAGLDVSALSVDADETISSISETDGKISVTKQDIAIASNQVTAMTGYTKPSSAPATPAIQQDDTANAAIGKLEYKADVNQTNILLVHDAAEELVDKGAKNIVPTIGSISKTSGGVDITWTVDGDGYITANPTNSDGRGFAFTSCQYVFSLEENKSYKLVVEVKTASTYSSAEIDLIRNDGTRVVTKGMKGVTGTWHTTVTIGTGNGGVYGIVSKNFDGVWRIMLCAKSEYDINPAYQSYALPNYDLTVREAEDRAALAEQVDEGAKNLFDLIHAPITDNNSTHTVSENSLTVTSNGQWSVAYTPITLPEGKWVIDFDVTAFSSTAAQVTVYRSTALQDYIGSIAITATGHYVLEVISTGATYYLGWYVNASSTSSTTNTMTISNTMICDADKYKISPSYQPYAAPNYDLTRMVSELQKKAVKVYTYHVNPNESDPEDAVTYLDDATGLTPAKMGASSFSYGSWANAWFLPRPCVLKFDGTVDYYLNPNDYSKKTDGTASTIDSSNSTGNVMLEFPKIYVKRVNDGNGARTVSIAPVNVDGTYKCWSNINAEDKEVDHFYLPAYNGTIHSSKMRSLSGVTLNTTYAPNYTRAQEVTAATANNPAGKNMWYTETWADFCLIYDLLYLMGKSLDVQRTFGQGLSSGSETAMRAYVTGTHNSKGLFYGDISGTSTAVKVLGMENLWGCRWHGVAGLINDNGTLKVKMTYGVADGSTTVGYNTTGSGYLNYGSTYGTDGFVKKMQADNTMGYKIIETAGTDATYYCDYYYTNNNQSNYARLGGGSGNGSYCGFSVHLLDGAENAVWGIGGSLSCRP